MDRQRARLIDRQTDCSRMHLCENTVKKNRTWGFPFYNPKAREVMLIKSKQWQKTKIFIRKHPSSKRECGTNRILNTCSCICISNETGDYYKEKRVNVKRFNQLLMGAELYHILEGWMSSWFLSFYIYFIFCGRLFPFLSNGMQLVRFPYRNGLSDLPLHPEEAGYMEDTLTAWVRTMKGLESGDAPSSQELAIPLFLAIQECFGLPSKTSPPPMTRSLP